ncbi:MAG: hypothetical protein NWS72_00655 [Thermoleophilia bacterium]|nr:hypothetical protein [Thermoleophilia bacterium]
MAVVTAALAIPLLSGCSARLSQFVDIAPDGGGNMALELRLDPAAQKAINLPRQLQEGTFERFLDVRKEKWSAPGNASLPFAQRTEANGTVVLRTVRRLRAGGAPLADLESALSVQRPLQPIVAATGRYWAAPDPRARPTTTSTTPGSVTAPGGEPDVGITGLPRRVPLQTLLVDEFRPALTERGEKVLATFSMASRGGVGDVLDPPCNGGSTRTDFTRADRALQRGVDFSYRWGMPARISLYSPDARISSNGYAASWSMPYGACERMEISSVGAEDGRFVNGLIMGAAIIFLAFVFALRAVSRRRGRARGDLRE